MLVVVAAGALYGGVWLWKSKDSLFVSSSMKTGVYPQQELPSDLPKEILAPAQSASENKADTSSDKEANRPSEMAGQQPAERKEIPVAVNAPECAVSPGPNDVLPEEKPVETSQAAQSHRLEVEAIQKTWIKVVIDNKNTQNVVLKPGEKREWEAGETMRVELGNAAGVQMKWDGEPLGPMGKPGRAVRFTLPNPAQPKKPETPQ
jgi:cytoskeletal protein RodZ